jgi:hypothetical protein
MTIHHATVKKAAKFGVILSEVETSNGTMAKALWAERNTAFVHRDPKQAFAAVALHQRLKADYPALNVAQNADGWAITTGEGEDFQIVLENIDVTDEQTLSDVIDAAIDLGIDPEDGYEEAEDTGQIVPNKYRVKYAAEGHPDDCGDFLAAYSRELALEEFIAMCAENGVTPTAKLNAAMETQTRGWQGRVRMSMGLMLRRMIDLNGEFIHLGKEVKIR